ncbi:MAG: hypothetical protein M1838_002884 [Thelocarpon superellum]|nr:MAG: hypothetical protein M1838_002884 [Thelocarpon superellum]
MAGRAKSQKPGSPFVEQAVDAREYQMEVKGRNWVQLSIDIPQETIQFASTPNIHVYDPASAMSVGEPGYNFFKHDHSGSGIASITFIYSFPEASKSKDHMNTAFVTAERAYEVKIATKLETTELEEATEAWIKEQLGTPT